MTIVAGVDFGTLSVRVTLVDSKRGPIGTASASYPLHRRREDPDFATQSHADQMTRAGRSHARGAEEHGRRRRAASRPSLWTRPAPASIPVGEGLEAAGRLLSVVRSSRLRRGRGDYPEGARSWASKASSGAAASTRTSGASPSCCTGCATIPDKRDRIRHRPRALRHGGGHAVRRDDRERAEAQRLRHGPQVDVESQVGRPAAGGVSGGRGSAVCTACAPSWAANI